VETVLKGLAQLIADGYAEGRMHFGDLELDLDSYAGRIKAIVQKTLGREASDDAIVQFAEKLHYKDLYLAIACAKEGLGFPNHADSGCTRSSAAWQALETKYKSFIRDLVWFFSRHNSATEDTAEDIVAELFLPDRSGKSRIMSYDGRGSLCTWLRVVFSNRAINQRRSPASQPEELTDKAQEKLALDHVEHVMNTDRYRQHLSDAVNEACAQLTRSERLLLLWRYVDGMRLGQIASLLDIHQANVTRRLNRICSKLQNGVVHRLSSNILWNPNL
jgi:RNA polymerase sigma-70 factor